MAWFWLPKLPLQNFCLCPLSFGKQPFIGKYSRTTSAVRFLPAHVNLTFLCMQARQQIQQRAQVRMLSSSSRISSMPRSLDSRRVSPRG